MQIISTDEMNKSPNKAGQDIEEIDDLIEYITLNIFHIGTKRTNFQILKMLPTSVKEIMTETGLTKVPVNKYINELEKYGLLQREKGTGKVNETEMTEVFKNIIEEVFMKEVKINVLKILPKLID